MYSILNVQRNTRYSYYSLFCHSQRNCQQLSGLQMQFFLCSCYIRLMGWLQLHSFPVFLGLAGLSSVCPAFGNSVWDSTDYLCHFVFVVKGRNKFKLKKHIKAFCSDIANVISFHKSLVKQSMSNVQEFQFNGLRKSIIPTEAHDKEKGNCEQITQNYLPVPILPTVCL